MNIDDLLLLPSKQETIPMVYDFLKSASQDEKYQAMVFLLKIYYERLDPSFHTIFSLLSNDENFPKTSYFEAFCELSASYFLNQEDYENAYQWICQMHSPHVLFSRLYFETDRFLDCKRELLYVGENASYLAYMAFFEGDYDLALRYGQKATKNDYEFFEAAQVFYKGGKLDFSEIENPSINMRVLMASIKGSILKGEQLLLLYEEIKPLLKDSSLAYQRRFLKAIYGNSKNPDFQRNLFVEIEKINLLLDKPFVFKGEDVSTKAQLSNLYNRFKDIEETMKRIQVIDLNLEDREIFRQVMMEVDKRVPFCESIYLEYGDNITLFDYKKNLCYDKIKDKSWIINTPFEAVFLTKEAKIGTKVMDSNEKDIITQKSLLELGIRSYIVFPYFKNDEVDSALLFYGTTLTFFDNFTYEFLNVLKDSLMEKVFIRRQMNTLIKKYQSYPFLIEQMNLGIKIQKGIEVTFNDWGKKMNEAFHYETFLLTNLVYQTSLRQVREGIIDSFAFDCTIQKHFFHEELKKVVFQGEIIYLSIITDVSEEKKALNYQTILAETSYISNLPNRRMLERDLIDYLDGKFTIFSLEINRFKMFNEVYGYEAGDIALKTLGRIVKKLDNMKAYHLDGCQFILLYDYINDQRAIKKVAKELLNTLEEEMENENYRFRFTFSLSSLRYPVHTNDTKPSRLIKYAMSGLSNAKDFLGLKSVYLDYNRKDYKNDIYEQILMTQVSEAMDTNRLLIKYQQVVNVKTNRVLHYDCKLNITNFNVDAKYLIEVAKKRMLIKEMDYYLIRNALKEVSEILKVTGKYIKVSLGIHIDTFLQDNFIEFLKNEITLEGIKPEVITIEILGELNNLEFVRESITTLRNFKIKVALNQMEDLIKVNCDYLKIKGANDYLQNEHSILIIKQMEILANQMGTYLILDDIEQMGSVQLLKGLGLSFVEGDCFMKKATKDELIKKMGGKSNG